MAPRDSFVSSNPLGYSVIVSDRGFALIVRDEVALHLWLSKDESWRKRPGTKPIVSGAESFLAGTASCRISVSGIEELYQKCEKKKIVHPNGALKKVPYGATEFAVLDLDGNLITFFEPD